MKSYVVGQVPSGYAPLPPENVLINGVRYPADISGQYTISWAPNPREHMHGPAVSGDETYTLRLYGESDTLIRTVTGITGNSYTWGTEGADSGLIFNDNFNRTTLGSDWTAFHYDGSGSVTLNGATITISSSASGDFESTSDAASLVFHPWAAETHHQAIVKTVTTGLPAWFRSLGMRKSTAANSAYVQIMYSGATGKITIQYRLTDGATATYDTALGTVGYNSLLPVWVKATYDGSTASFWTSQMSASGPWDLAGTLSIAGMTGWILCDSFHGAATEYDDFESYDWSNLNSSIRAELETVRGGVTSYQKQVIKSTRSVTAV